MVFREKKIDSGYEYFTEDFYGTINLKCKDKLEPATLDRCVLRLMKGDLSSGSIRSGDIDIDFEFVPKSGWFDDDEN